MEDNKETKYYIYSQEEFIPLTPFCKHKGKWYQAEVWDGAQGHYITHPEWKEFGIGRDCYLPFHNDKKCSLDEELEYWITEWKILLPSSPLEILVLWGTGEIDKE